MILSEIEQSIKNKIEAVGTPLKDWDISINYGIKTGYNDAFIISAEKRQEILDNCHTPEEYQRTADLIRPILRGRDIKRYNYDFADLFLICTFPSKHYDIDDYPAVKDYLLTFDKRKLEQSGEKNIDGIKGNNARKKTNNKWFETSDSIAYWDDFSKQKIIYPETTQGAYFVLDNDKYMIDKTCFMIIGENLNYLLSTLSSKLFEFAYKHLFSSIELGSTGYQYNKHALVKLPIVKYKHNEILSDKEIYELYNLSNEEISFIDSEI